MVINVLFNRMPEKFFTLLISTIILSQLGFSLDSKVFSTLFALLFIAISVLTVHFYYRKPALPTNNILLLMAIPVLSLFVLGKSSLLVGVLIVTAGGIPVLFNSKTSRGLKITSISLSLFALTIGTVVLGFTLLFNSLLSGFIVREEIKKLPSPNGQYFLVVINIDQGALGGNTVVYVERPIFGVAKWHRLLYLGHCLEIPILAWSGNYKVVINGVPCNILFGRKVNQVFGQ